MWCVQYYSGCGGSAKDINILSRQIPLLTVMTIELELNEQMILVFCRSTPAPYPTRPPSVIIVDENKAYFECNDIYSCIYIQK